MRNSSDLYIPIKHNENSWSIWQISLKASLTSMNPNALFRFYFNLENWADLLWSVRRPTIIPKEKSKENTIWYSRGFKGDILSFQNHFKQSRVIMASVVTSARTNLLPSGSSLNVLIKLASWLDRFFPIIFVVCVQIIVPSFLSWISHTL